MGSLSKQMSGYKQNSSYCMLEEEIVPQTIWPSSGAPQPDVLDKTLQLRSSNRNTHTRKFSEAAMCGKFHVSSYELEY